MSHLRECMLLLILVSGTGRALANGQDVQEGVAHQDSQQSSSRAVTEIDSVVVDGSSYNARRDDTASRIVVSKDELLRHGDSYLIDALKRLPSITVKPGVGGRGAVVSMRGLGEGYTQILVDGRRAPAGFDIESLTPDMIERVEIIRSALAEMSSEAIAGVINIVLTKPKAETSTSVKAGTGYSRAGWLPNFSLSHSSHGENHQMGLDVSASRREFMVEEEGRDLRLNAEGAVESIGRTALKSNGFRDVVSLLPSASIVLANGDRISARVYADASNYNKYVKYDADAEMGAPYAFSASRQITYIDVVQMEGSVDWSHEFEALGKLSANFTFGGNDEESSYREISSLSGGELGFAEHTEGDIHVRRINFSGKYSLPEYGGHRLELGWEGGNDQREEGRSQRLYQGGDGDEATSDRWFDASIRRIALYGQDEWEISKKLSLYLGARWEKTVTESSGNNFSIVRNKTDIFSPIAQVLWRVSPDSGEQIRFSFSRTYKAPELRQLIPRPYTSSDNRRLNPDFQGNPMLRSELATGFDIAYEKFWKNDSQLALNAYVRDIDSVIRSEISLIDERWVSSPMNGGKALVRGLELDVKSFLPWKRPNSKGVSMRFNAARNWSEVDDVPSPNNRLARQPELTASFSADYEASKSWTVGGSFSYQSGGWVNVTPYQSDFESSSKDIDFYSLWKLSNKTKLRLSFANVLARDVVSGQQYVDNGIDRSWRSRDSYVVVRVNLEHKFD